jgi:hypothetical protein
MLPWAILVSHFGLLTWHLTLILDVDDTRCGFEVAGRICWLSRLQMDVCIETSNGLYCPRFV